MAFPLLIAGVVMPAASAAAAAAAPAAAFVARAGDEPIAVYGRPSPVAGIGSTAPLASPAAAASAALPAPSGSAQLHNPFKRDIELTMALTYSKRDLGELPVTLTRDDRVLVHSQEFLALIGPLLSPAGSKRVDVLLSHKQVFEPSELLPAGVALEFDPSGLSVVILRIDPGVQAPQMLYALGHMDRAAGLAPAAFSAYANLSTGLSWSPTTGAQPYFDAQGVVRFQHFVLESEFVGQDTVEGVASPVEGFTVQRDYVRLVYDRPDQDLRFYAGDLSAPFRDDQSQLNIGGVGVVRQSQIFDPTRLASLNSSQQFVLQNDATVDIMRNGQLLQQLHLTAGSYNLNNLPLASGSNNLTVQIHGVDGQDQTLNFSTYLDPIDLQPGDYEYAAFAGALSSTLFNQPQYERDIAFSGYFRKAFMNATAVGVGLQADQNTQMLDGEYRLLLPRGARAEFAVGVSHIRGVGEGETASVEYDLSVDRGGGLYDSLNARLRYNSPHFETVGEDQTLNPDVADLSATYTHSYSADLQTSLNGLYEIDRGTGKWSASFDIDNAWRFSRHWTLHVGAGYQATVTTAGETKGLGAMLTLTWRPSADIQAEATYDGVENLASVDISKSHENYVNEYGYSAVFGENAGSPSISGEADYVGDRFNLDVQGGTSGSGFAKIAQDPTASVIVGTSIGFVDGHFAIGRPITDSFVVAYPNQSLTGDRRVIVGDDLEQGHYDSESGLLGPALYANLASYADDVVHYDAVNPPQGYDIGAGVTTVHPSYRSGYALQVGADAYVSAAGTLLGADGKPIALVSGHVSALDDPGFQKQLFFTNSVGRFAITGLKPGRRYRVDLNVSQTASFTFETPKSGVALVNLKSVSVSATAD